MKILTLALLSFLAFGCTTTDYQIEPILDPLKAARIEADVIDRYTRSPQGGNRFPDRRVFCSKKCQSILAKSRPDLDLTTKWNSWARKRPISAHVHSFQDMETKAPRWVAAINDVRDSCATIIWDYRFDGDRLTLVDTHAVLACPIVSTPPRQELESLDVRRGW